MLIRGNTPPARGARPPRLGEGVRVGPPGDPPLGRPPPPIHVAVNLEGTADLDLASGPSVLLHTEQGGYTLAPRPPAFTKEAVSFARAGAVVLGTE